MKISKLLMRRRARKLNCGLILEIFSRMSSRLLSGSGGWLPCCCELKVMSRECLDVLQYNISVWWVEKDDKSLNFLDKEPTQTNLRALSPKIYISWSCTNKLGSNLDLIPINWGAIYVRMQCNNHCTNIDQYLACSISALFSMFHMKTACLRTLSA